MTVISRAAHRGRRRFLPLVWSASAVSAAVLVLGVNGTLSSWTAAVITNDTNTVATGKAVVLKEVGPGASPTVCISSSGGGVTNSVSCSVNKYGGTATPLTPTAPTQTVDVTFSNVGTGPATTFKLEPQTCSQSPAAAAAGAGTPAVNNLCTTGASELGVDVKCSNGTSYNAANAWSDLKYDLGAPGTMPATLTHTSVAGQTLTTADSWTCHFTVTLNSNASPSSSGITLTQALKWTLTA